MKTQQEILATLLAWQMAMVECSNKMDRLRALVGDLTESPFGDAINGLMDAYTESVAVQIGWDGNALTAWWLDHDFGAKPMQIGLKDEPLRRVSNLDELAFIVDDLRRAQSL